MGSKGSKPLKTPAELAGGTTASSDVANDAVRSNNKRPRNNGNDKTTLKKTKKGSGVQKSSLDRHVSWSRGLATETDKTNLNEYSCFIRQQLELFCLSQEGVDYIRETYPGKYKNRGSCLVAGQVGIRCKHCQKKTSFPGNLNDGVYVSQMSFVVNHLMNGCIEMDNETHKKLLELNRSFGGKGGRGGGKKKGPYTTPEYVAKCLQDIGIEESPARKGLFLHK